SRTTTMKNGPAATPHANRMRSMLNFIDQAKISEQRITEPRLSSCRPGLQDEAHRRATSDRWVINVNICAVLIAAMLSKRSRASGQIREHLPLDDRLAQQ